MLTVPLVPQIAGLCPPGVRSCDTPNPSCTENVSLMSCSRDAVRARRLWGPRYRDAGSRPSSARQWQYIPPRYDNSRGRSCKFGQRVTTLCLFSFTKVLLLFKTQKIKPHGELRWQGMWKWPASPPQTQDCGQSCPLTCHTGHTARLNDFTGTDMSSRLLL